MRTVVLIVLLTVTFTPPVSAEITVQLTEGDNLVSINVIPPDSMFLADEDRGPDFPLMFEQIRDHVLLIRDYNGRFYRPEMGFNNLPYLDLTKAYLIRVNEDVEITWGGEQIPADADIPLGQGENWIAYYPEYELDASAPDFHVLSPIIDVVESAYDMLGGDMYPDSGFSDMEPWRPGRGYIVNVTE